MSLYDIRRALAKWLAPEMAKDQERYYRLRSSLSTLRDYSAGIKPVQVVLQHAIDMDADYWRPIGHKSRDLYSSDPMQFREELKTVTMTWLRDNLTDTK